MQNLRRWVLIALILIPVTCAAQVRTIHVPLYENGDTTYWYTYQYELVQRLSLSPLTKSDHNYHFRIWMDRQAIDLWQESNGDIKGLLTSWAKENTPEEEEPTNRIAHRAINLDSSTVKKLNQLINDSDINSLPDQEKIAGWKQGLDGIEYIIELIDKENYYLKTYWTPTTQGDLKEAKIIESFVQDAVKLVSAHEEWKLFAATIPYECYMNSSMTIACKILSSADKRRLKKEREKYRKSQIK